MTKSMKNTLKSVLVMAIIAVIAVGSLAVANAFFPEYQAKLDKKTAALINSICPTGVSDAEAFSGGYMVMEPIDRDTLAAFNDRNGVEKNNKVLAVYNMVKGGYAGYRVVEAQAQGYGGNPVIITLTSFDKNNKIGKVAVKQQKENPTGEHNIFLGAYFEKFLGYAAGLDKVSPGDITAATGATNSSSVKGLANAVNISVAVIGELFTEEDLTPKPVTGTKLLNALKSLSESETFLSYPVPLDKKKTVYGIYKGDKGDVLVAGKGEGYGGAMGIVVKVDGEGRIAALAIAEHNETISAVPGNGSAFAPDFNDAWLTERFKGKSLGDINAMDNVLNGTTGATLVRTGPAIKDCLVNALGYYPLAEQYVEGIDAAAEEAV